MMVPAGAVGLIGAGTMGAANVGIHLAQATPPDDIGSYFAQLGAVGLVIGVGFWLIRRYDARADTAAQQARDLLEAERKAHDHTRQLLIECLKAHNP